MTSDSLGQETPSLGEAIRLFNEHEYFACHDVLEEMWGDTLGDDRDFLQGLLHAAVSLFHLSEGNPSGAHKMHGSSLRYLARYPDWYRGIDLAQLRSDLTGLFERARRGGTLNMAEYPTLNWSPADE